MAMRSIHMVGSEEQKQRWLPAMARCEKLGAFALTEPRHGSDSVSLETEARREGDEYVINGAKRWIGNGSLADVVVMWARDTEDLQVKGFLIEKGTPGYDARPIQGKGSLRALWQADIDLVDVRVPAENLLPGSSSFKDPARVLKSTRAGFAWAAVGHAVAVAWYRREASLAGVTCGVRAVTPCTVGTAGGEGGCGADGGAARASGRPRARDAITAAIGVRIGRIVLVTPVRERRAGRPGGCRRSTRSACRPPKRTSSRPN